MQLKYTSQVRDALVSALDSLAESDPRPDPQKDLALIIGLTGLYIGDTLAESLDHGVEYFQRRGAL